jgi:hypothetical protein
LNEDEFFLAALKELREAEEEAIRHFHNDDFEELMKRRDISDKEIKNSKLIQQIRESNEHISFLSKKVSKTVRFTDSGSYDGYSLDPDSMPICFLSFAYDDKPLTLALFFYFQSKGKYLWVDWMHNNKISEYSKLVECLIKPIDISSDFFFLLTPNSYVISKYRMYLRSWCSWEMGAFAHHMGPLGEVHQFYISFQETPLLIGENTPLIGFRPMQKL